METISIEAALDILMRCPENDECFDLYYRLSEHKFSDEDVVIKVIRGKPNHLMFCIWKKDWTKKIIPIPSKIKI